MTARVTNVKGSSSEQADTIGGYNADYKMYILDESQAIPDPVWIPIEGGLGGLINITITIFNPTRTKGKALKSQYEDRDQWITLRWSQEDCERIDHVHRGREDYRDRYRDPWPHELPGHHGDDCGNTCYYEERVADHVAECYRLLGRAYPGAHKHGDRHEDCRRYEDCHGQKDL